MVHRTTTMEARLRLFVSACWCLTRFHDPARESSQQVCSHLTRRLHDSPSEDPHSQTVNCLASAIQTKGLAAYPNGLVGRRYAADLRWLNRMCILRQKGQIRTVSTLEIAIDAIPTSRFTFITCRASQFQPASVFRCTYTSSCECDTAYTLSGIE